MVTWAAACAFWFATNVKAKTFCYDCYDACTGADGGVGVGSSTVVAVVAVAAAAAVASVSVLAAAFCCCCS